MGLHRFFPCVSVSPYALLIESADGWLSEYISLSVTKKSHLLVLVRVCGHEMPVLLLIHHCVCVCVCLCVGVFVPQMDNTHNSRTHSSLAVNPHRPHSPVNRRFSCQSVLE